MVRKKENLESCERVIIFSAVKSINSLREIFVARYPNGRVQPNAPER